MTARHRCSSDQAQLHWEAEALISRAREAVPRVDTDSLDRIRGVLEAGLAGEPTSDAVLAELVRTLAVDP